MLAKVSSDVPELEPLGATKLTFSGRFPGNLAQIDIRGKAGSFIWARFRQRCAAGHRDNLARGFRQVRQVQLIALGSNHEGYNGTRGEGSALARSWESNNLVVWHCFTHYLFQMRCLKTFLVEGVCSPPRPHKQESRPG